MTYSFDSEKLIQLRKAQFWTQEDLSAASGVSVRTIQRIEREGGGSLETWKALAAAFDVAVEGLQSTPSKSHRSAFEKRNALIGILIGLAGAFLGCGIALGGWWSFLHEQSAEVNAYVFITVYVGFFTALCFIPPILIWQKYLR